MRSRAAAYTIDRRSTVEEVRERLSGAFTCRRTMPPEQEVTYYDTFDWRLHRAGDRLRVTEPDPHRVWLHSSTNGLRVPPLTEDATPAFADELPAGPLRERLENVASNRRLLPQVTVETRSERFDVLDDERKTVARGTLERRTARDPEHGAVELPTRLRVTGVRGYDADFDRLCHFVAGTLMLEPARADELDEALAALGRRPGSARSRIAVELAPDQPAAEALKAVFRPLLGAMAENEQGMRRGIDTEFLHDFRVAVRRTRTLLRHFDDVFPAAVADHYKAEFRWLGAATGPLRDLDVLTAELPGYAACLSPDSAHDLEPLYELLAERASEERRLLAAALDNPRHERLTTTWGEWLAADTLPQTHLPAGTAPIGELAPRRIGRRARKLLELAASVHADTPAERIHRLRIEGKRLRYLFDAFRSLLPRRRTAVVLRELKRIQEVLGEFNDQVVHGAMLEGYAKDLGERGPEATAAVLAVGRILAHLEDRHVRSRRKLEKRLARFARAENRKHLRTLLGGS